MKRRERINPKKLKPVDKLLVYDYLKTEDPAGNQPFFYIAANSNKFDGSTF